MPLQNLLETCLIESSSDSQLAHTISSLTDALAVATRYIYDPAAGGLLLFATIILFMKLISYAHVNHDYRQAAREAAVRPLQRPSNQPPPAARAAAAELSLPSSLPWLSNPLQPTR